MKKAQLAPPLMFALIGWALIACRANATPMTAPTAASTAAPARTPTVPATEPGAVGGVEVRPLDEATAGAMPAGETPEIVDVTDADAVLVAAYGTPVTE
jgi:hypothetical protein